MLEVTYSQANSFSLHMTDVPQLEPLADGTGFRARVRYCGERRRIRIALTDPVAAESRALELIAMGEQLTDAKQPAELAEKLVREAGAADAARLAKLKAAVAQLGQGAPSSVRQRVRAAGGLFVT